jgi:cytoskeletal protein RodZ
MDSQSLGHLLRQTRETRELTLDEAETSLRIRRRILESFELGDFNLPGFSPVQVNGFIRNYARYLGLDEDEILQFYESAKIEDSRRARRKSKTKQPNAKQPDKRASQEVRAVGRSILDTQPLSPPPVTVVASSANGGLREPRSSGLTGLLLRLLVAGAALAVIAFVVIQVLQTTPLQFETDDPPQDILAEVPSIPTFTLVPTATLALPTATPIGGQLFSGQGVQVTITLRQRSWLRVAVDGAERFTGIARPGTILDYLGNANIDLRASNAEALDIIYNGQRQGAFGDRGQRVDVAFSPTGVQISGGQRFEEPTPEASFTPIPTSATDVGDLIAALTPSSTPGPSPTATDTPPPSDTPTITLTPSITPTPTATATATTTPGPSPTATAILPPREPRFTPTPTKSG